MKPTILLLALCLTASAQGVPEPHEVAASLPIPSMSMIVSNPATGTVTSYAPDYYWCFYSTNSNMSGMLPLVGPIYLPTITTNYVGSGVFTQNWQQVYYGWVSSNSTMHATSGLSPVFSITLKPVMPVVIQQLGPPTNVWTK